MRLSIYMTMILALVLCGGGIANAQTPTGSPITVEQAWARATPKGAMTGAAYMTLVNNGATADRLVGASTPLADSVQFHTEIEDNGISRMRKVNSVDLPPGAKIAFKPRDMHMMIVRLKQPLTEGETLPLTLQFEKAGSIAITIPIEKIGAMQHEDIQHGEMKPDSMGATSSGDAMKK